MDLKSKIDIYEGFPREGISFKDINSLLLDPEAVSEVAERFYQKVKDWEIDLVVMPESRGYMIGAILAYKLGVGMAPIRKPGKLPGEIFKEEYELEYGKGTLEVQEKAVKKGEKILIIDDLLATGGTVSATAKLLEKLGGKVVGALFLIELTGLKGREALDKYKVESLVEYEF